MSQAEPVDTTKYSFIWDRAVVDGELVKLYRLTKLSKDKLSIAASKVDVDRLSDADIRILHEIDFIRSAIEPQLVAETKRRILGLLDSKHGNRRYRDLYMIHSNRSLLKKAYDELLAEGKIVLNKGSWIKKA